MVVECLYVLSAVETTFGLNRRIIVMIRVKFDKEDKLLRVFMKWIEVAYCKFEISGLGFNVEFPSDWHEERLGWIRVGAGLFRIGLSFPWKWVVPDNYQCSGPHFGFLFFGDSLHMHWGKSNGKRDDPSKLIQMPWGWRFVEHNILSEKEKHNYTYTLNSGEIQKREATINVESREWQRPWFPRRFYKESIDIEFNGEVGERTGTWKGGVLGCGYNIKEGETPLECLRRMESEREF